jgi:uncharacterized Zn finger protein
MNNLSKKKGLAVQPVRIEGHTIARSFWGKAWCEHLEQFSDYANRLPRGRTYVRNGSVCHLEIQKGRILANVSGSELYDIEVKIKTLPGEKWKNLKTRCAGGVGSLLELLQGKLSGEVMAHVTNTEHGLFPLPAEIELDCSCPDWAGMCKHVAAALYGVGARLDEKPELLFLLRGVDHAELVGVESAAAVTTPSPASSVRTLDSASLADVFGIDMAPPATAATAEITPPKASRPGRATPKNPVRKRKLKTPKKGKTTTSSVRKHKVAKRK